LLGRTGADLLEGDSGNDTLGGGDNDDTLVGGAGADSISGGSGTDTASYASSDAVRINLTLGTGQFSDAAGDTFGSVENIIGTQVADDITGDNAGNRLQGLGGDDDLTGADGADTLDGGLGFDELNGGNGADKFIYAALNDSTVAAPDDILDFSTAQGDKVDLVAIDANTLVGGDQAFTFIGNAAFTNVAGQLHYTGGTFLEGDVNGNGVADFRIVLHVASMSAGDFVL
jgi:serralysin